MFAGTSFFITLGSCAIMAAGVVIWLRQQQIFQREAFQALAARRGWSLTVTEQKLGRPAMLRLTARSGSGWHAESWLGAGDAPGTRNFLTTVFTAEDPHWEAGTLVLTPAPAADTTDALPPGRSQQSLDMRIAMAVPAGLQVRLLPYAAPDSILVQASHDPAHQFDFDALSKVIDAWEPQRMTSDGLPVMVLGPDGFRVQVNHGMRRADEMEQFIDLALDLIRVM